jgi:hypothetical protein
VNASEIGEDAQAVGLRHGSLHPAPSQRPRLHDPIFHLLLTQEVKPRFT